jgi:LAO/AO transport system kinase
MNELAERIRRGDVRALARACRLVDERAPPYRELLRELFGESGRAARIGITGPPGVGKSTLTDALIATLRARGERVGVVAVDPSSPFSGGALLGDRIRMQRHASDAEVFIRSLGTRGAQGGMSRSAAEVVSLLEAWGASTVLVETVGVGQAEFELLGVVHSIVLVAMPGSGDDIQANKAGIVEAADVIALNKADRPGTDAAESELMSALALPHLRFSGGATHGAASNTGAPIADDERWRCPIVRTVANRAEGLDALDAALTAHRAWLGSAAGRRRVAERERRRWLGFLREVVADQVFAELAPAIDALVSLVEARALDPYSAAERLLSEFQALRSRSVS